MKSQVFSLTAVLLLGRPAVNRTWLHCATRLQPARSGMRGTGEMQYPAPACLISWAQLPKAPRLAPWNIQGGGSRKQAGCINSQQNEYTEIPALLFLLSECGHKKIYTFSVGRGWVCERVECLLSISTIWEKVDLFGERILTAEFSFDWHIIEKPPIQLSSFKSLQKRLWKA